VRYTACICEKRKRATQRRSPGNGIEFGDLGTGGRITLNG